MKSIINWIDIDDDQPRLGEEVIATDGKKSMNARFVGYVFLTLSDLNPTHWARYPNTFEKVNEKHD